MAEETEFARAVVRLRAERDQLKRDLDAAKDDVRSAVSDMARVAGGILAAVGIRSFADSLKTLVGGIVSASSAMEGYQISLGVMLRSQARASELIEKIQDIAIVSPFTLQQMVEATTMLKIFGFEARELIPILKTVGNAASASPRGTIDGLQRISYALGQIKAQGRLMSRELRQLALAGVPVYDVLSKGLHMSMDKVRAAMKRGLLSSAVGLPILLKGMEERFGGLMAARARTFMGLKTSLIDIWQIYSRIAGKPAFKLLEQGMGKAVDYLLSPAGKMWPESIAKHFEKIIALVTRFVNSPFAQVALDIGKAAIQVGSFYTGFVLANKAISFTSRLIGELLTPTGLLAAAATAVTYSLNQALGGKNGQALKATLEKIGGLLWEITQNIRDNLLRAVEFLGRQWSLVFGDTMIGSSDKLWASVLKGIESVLKWVSLMTTDFKLTWELFTQYAALSMTNVKECLLAGWDYIKAAAIGSWEAIKAGFSTITPIIEAEINAWKVMFQSMLDNMLAGINLVIARLTGVGEAGAQAVVTATTVATQSAVDTAKSKRDKTVGEFSGKDSIGKMKDAFMTAFRAALNPALHAQHDATAEQTIILNKMASIMGQMADLLSQIHHARVAAMGGIPIGAGMNAHMRGQMGGAGMRGFMPGRGPGAEGFHRDPHAGAHNLAWQNQKERMQADLDRHNQEMAQRRADFGMNHPGLAAAQEHRREIFRREHPGAAAAEDKHIAARQRGKGGVAGAGAAALGPGQLLDPTKKSVKEIQQLDFVSYSKRLQESLGGHKDDMLDTLNEIKSKGIPVQPGDKPLLVRIEGGMGAPRAGGGIGNA